jgi:hypothetical protein
MTQESPPNTTAAKPMEARVGRSLEGVELFIGGSVMLQMDHRGAS